MFYISCIILFMLIVLKVYLKFTVAICQTSKRLDGRTAIVTGGTTGMGLQIATEFAKRGARVIIACPFEKEGQEGLKYIVNKTANKEVIFKLLDLSSLKSVRKFAEEIIRSEEKIDILVNNAGVFMAKEYITEDGMNSIMQTNYFGHFLLTILLIPILKKNNRFSETSRIINVTSKAHHKGNIDFERMNYVKYWSFFKVYANSKLCLLLFTRKLSKKLQRSNVVVNDADPGWASTYILKFRNVVVDFIISLFIQVINIFGKNPRLGAQTAIHVALDDDAGKMSGEVFYNCKVSKAANIAYDEELAEKLWERSAILVQLTQEEVLRI